MRRPNVRFLATCAAIMVVAAVAVHFLHDYQAKRTAGILLAKARAVRDQGNSVKAIGYYQRYAQLAPTDTEALAEFGQLLAEVPGNQFAAIFTLDQVLRQHGDLPKIRRQLVDLAVAAGQYDDAKAHLERFLLKQEPTDGQLWGLLGQCQQADRDFEGAAASYRLAIRYKPEGWQTYVRLAEVLRNKQQEPEEADKVMNAMVENNPDLPDAYHARGRYWMGYGKPTEALADGERAVALNDRGVAFALFAAIAAQSQNELEKAERYAAQARRLNARDPSVYIVSAQIAARKSDNNQAMEVLMQGISILPQDPNLLWSLGNVYIDLGKWDAVRQTIETLQKVSKDQVPPGYLEGRALLQQGDVLAAMTRLEQLREVVGDRVELRKQTDYWLGICYERVGNLDQQTVAFRRALESDPNWQAARSGLAGALATAGRIDEAIENYRHVLSVGEIPALGWQEYTRLLIRQQLRRSANRRDWREAEEAFARARQIEPDSPALAIVEADLLVAQGQGERAEEALAAACGAHPDAVELWVTRSTLLSRQGNYEEARAELRDAKSRLGDRAEIRMANIREALTLKLDAALAALLELSQGWDNFSQGEQFSLARETAAAYTVLGAADRAEPLWYQAIVLRPEWLLGYLHLFDAAAARNDQPALAKLLAQIERIEGRQRGPRWCYGEAVRLFLAASADKEPQLASVRILLDESLRQRPRWPRPFILLAEVEKLDGNLAAATERYQAAVDLGERNPALIRNLVTLLYQRQRFAEADQVLHALEEQQNPLSDDLGRLASQVAWRVEDYGRALELAQNIAATSNKVEDYLWLGQLHTLMRKPDQAEQAYLEAIKIDPQEPRGWLALAQHWVRLKSADAVEKTLLQAADHLAPADVALTRAHAFDLLQKPDAAEEEYQHALELSPADGYVLTRAAEFYLRQNKFTQAESVLRKSLQAAAKTTDEERALARRQLAVLIARDREFLRVREALALLARNETDPTKIRDEDRRAKAVVLAALPGRESSAEAIRILEKLVDHDLSQPKDRFLLSRLYQADNRWPPARRLLQGLIIAEDPQPAHLVSYVEGLLNHDDLLEAELWLARLEKMQPQDTATVDLRARMEFAKGRVEPAIAMIKQHALQLNSPAGKSWAANLLGAIAQKSSDPVNSQLLFDAAEEWYRSLLKDTPRSAAEYADFLARRNRVGEALDLCLQPGFSADPRSALMLAAAIANRAAASAADRQRVEGLILKYLSEHPEVENLFTALGTLYETKEEWDKAIQAYRLAIQANKKDVVALNNLAVLLAFRGQADQGEPLIEQAMALTGPIAAILDSRGTVGLNMGDSAAAVADFSAALDDQPSAAFWFHLALAQFRAQRVDAAKDAYKHAVAAGLELAQLHPLERSTFDQLRRQFDETADR